MPTTGHLVVLLPGRDATTVSLDQDSLEIGAGLQAGLRVTGPEVEPIHARIDRREDGHTLARVAGDVEVNGRRVKHHVLADGDLIVLGRAALSFRQGPAPQPEGGAARRSPTLELLILLANFATDMQTAEDANVLRDRLLSTVLELTGAERGVLLLRDHDSFERLAMQASAIGELTDAEIKVSRTLMARILEQRRPFIVTDAVEDSGLRDAESLRSASLRSVLCAPIMRGQMVIGAIYASRHRSPVPFSRGDLDLVTLFTTQLAQTLDLELDRRRMALRAHEAQRQLDATRERSILGESPALRSAMQQLRKTATTDLATLITGETGTGKELFAYELHRTSERSGGPFVPVNCAAIPADLIESELFGSVKGAFTGADAPRLGIIRSTAGGTLFLDEIGDLPPQLQAKLLRVLETKKVTPVGGTAAQTVDFRIVAATHRDLTKEVEAGRFRQDLYFRVAAVTIAVPSLRERGEDVIALARHFVEREATALGKGAMLLAPSALKAIRRHSWPGNVRELQAAVRRAVAIAESEVISADQLGLPEKPIDPDALVPLEQARDDFLKQYVLRAVQSHDGNRTAAARALGVTPRTIFKYLEEV